MARICFWGTFFVAGIRRGRPFYDDSFGCKNMIVEKILKKLTPEKIKKEVEAIQRIKLPPELQKWVKEYEKVGERNVLFWKFIYKINQTISPFNISAKYQNNVVKTKFLITMFIILLDDVADKIRNKKLLTKLLKIPTGQDYIDLDNLTPKERNYMRLSTKLWKKIKSSTKKYPRFKEFRHIFIYDFEQVLGAMNYAYLINKNPYLINKTEYWLYSPHTLQGMINCTLDLMCLPRFRTEEMGKIREVFWEAQRIVRVGNCLSTWRRELNEGDFTGGVFTYALSSGLIDIKDLHKKNKANIINKIDNSNIKSELLEECQSSYNKIYHLCKKIKSLSYRIFSSQLEKSLLMYLISDNYDK